MVRPDGWRTAVLAGRVEPEDHASMPRIFLHPGTVVSQTDHDVHYVSSGRLASLYGVRLQDCIIITGHQSETLGYRAQAGDVHLHPRSDGNYHRLAQMEDVE